MACAPQRRHLHRRHAEQPDPDDRHATGMIHTVAGDGSTGAATVRSATAARRRARICSCRATCSSRRHRRHLHRRHAPQPHPPRRREDAASSRRSPATARSDAAATTGRRPKRAWRARRASRWSPEPRRRDDDLHRRLLQRAVRAVGPDGIMRNVSDEGRVVFGAPSRVAFGGPSAGGSTSPTRATNRSSR